MKDAKGHGSDARGGGMSQDARRNAGNAAHGKVRGMPIPGHPFHTKTNDELQYIAKDANAAAKAQRGMASEGKYLDQVNDAATVLGWRARGGKDLSQSPAADIAAQHGVSGPAVAGHGPFPSNADFMAKYGGPRDHAAEQRGFNSGMREINRLKRQGK